MTKIKTQSILLCESWQVAQPSYVYRVSNLPLRVVRSLFGNKQGGIDMKTIKCKLTVYFAEPFWVGVFERICDGKLSVAKVTFGAEPKDYDIQEFVLNSFVPSRNGFRHILIPAQYIFCLIYHYLNLALPKRNCPRHRR